MPRGRPSRATVYSRLDSALEELQTKWGGLPTPQESESIWSDIWHLEAHHSTALEGNTLVLREVEQLLDQKRAVGAKELREYMEVQGYGEAARWVYAQALDPQGPAADSLISVTELRWIHERAMTPVWQVTPHPDAGPDEGPGAFRKHDIHPFAAGMKPPDWPLVETEIRTWVETANALADHDETPLPERLAAVHDQFERVHPFIDGNGRTGRLALNLILVRLGYPPVIILKQHRDRYLKALQKADNGDLGPLGEILAQAMHDNLNRFIIPNFAGPAKLVPLPALTDGEMSLAALRQAAQRGRLTAYQGSDGLWRSSRNLVEEYKANRHRRGT